MLLRPDSWCWGITIFSSNLHFTKFEELLKRFTELVILLQILKALLNQDCGTLADFDFLNTNCLLFAKYEEVSWYKNIVFEISCKCFVKSMKLPWVTVTNHIWQAWCICCWMCYKTIKWIVADVMDGCCKWFFVTRNSRLDNDKLSTVANCKLDWLVHGAAVGSPWRAEIQGRVGHGGHRGVARGTWTWEIVGADTKVSKVRVGERFGGGDPGAGVERQHLA